eukprot:Hpha_TRINITY_DN27262_c0_g1::TRINITY_DN27262_c0_g1_i1::g.140711::m.140711
MAAAGAVLAAGEEEAEVEDMETPDGVYTGTVRAHPRPDEPGVIKWGRGILRRPCGAVYEGEFRYDAMSGSGVLTAPEGDLYEGEFWGNLRHGIGIQTYAAGGSYEGQWMHDMRNGKGDEFILDGTRYEGLWREDRRHGFGKLILPNGVALRGEFAEGEPHGKGTVEYPNGDTWSGGFKNGRRHGEGRYVVARSNYIHFEVFENGRCMQGSLAHPPRAHVEYPNGDTFQGEYQRGDGESGDLSETGWDVPLPAARDGTPHGCGVLQQGGCHYRGQIENGVPEGDGEIEYSEDTECFSEGVKPIRYVGCFHLGVPTGWGSLDLSNGDRREGCWNQLKREGLQWHWKAGDALEGAWESGMWHNDTLQEANRYPRAEGWLEADRSARLRAGRGVEASE